MQIIYSIWTQNTVTLRTKIINWNRHFKLISFYLRFEWNWIQIKKKKRHSRARKTFRVMCDEKLNDTSTLLFPWLSNILHGGKGWLESSKISDTRNSGNSTRISKTPIESSPDMGKKFLPREYQWWRWTNERKKKKRKNGKRDTTAVDRLIEKLSATTVGHFSGRL